jgi:hypothetical protein
MKLSAVNGTRPSSTKADGQSAIDNSKVAIASVTAEIAAAATSAARTEGLAAAVVVGDVVEAMQFCRTVFTRRSDLTRH